MQLWQNEQCAGVNDEEVSNSLQKIMTWWHQNILIDQISFFCSTFIFTFFSSPPLLEGLILELCFGLCFGLFLKKFAGEGFFSGVSP